jgi:acetate kinase
MAKHILAVNAGSSSLKCVLFSASASREPKRLASANASGLSGDEITLELNIDGKAESSSSKQLSSHVDVFEAILKRLQSDDKLLVKETDLAIAHRVVHGGDFGDNLIISEETLHQLEPLESLAPLSDTHPTQLS